MGKGGNRKDGYRVEDGKICIDLSLEKPEQVFDLRDPAPLRLRDIDDDLVDLVTSAVQEFPLNQPMKLHVIFSERNLSKKKKKPITDEEICLAIRNHFTYMAKLTDKKLRKTLKNYQMFLGIGLLILVGCLAGVHALASLGSSGPLSILKQGIEILAWVSAWRPIEALLYDWWPIHEKRKTFDKIAAMQIDITDSQTEQTTTNVFYP